MHFAKDQDVRRRRVEFRLHKGCAEGNKQRGHQQTIDDRQSVTIARRSIRHRRRDASIENLRVIGTSPALPKTFAYLATVGSLWSLPDRTDADR